MGILVEQMQLHALQKACDTACRRKGIDNQMTVHPLENAKDALVERRAFHNEGTAPRHLTIRNAWDGRRPSAQAIAMVDAFVAHLRQLHDRDAAIVAAGGDVRDPPPWAFAVHPMAIAIARNGGWDPVLLATLDVEREQRTGIMTMIRHEAAAVRETSQWEGLACGMHASLSHRTEEWEYKDVTGTPVLWIRRKLPATLVQAMVGMKVDDVVDDPRLQGSDAVIESTMTTQANGEIVLFLRKERRTVVPPPAGIDLSWLVHGMAGTPSL